MDEKKYSIIGKVEIGTDEYRDLIEAVKEAERNYSDTNSKLWNERSRANAAEEQLKAANVQLDKVNGFINSSEEIKMKYKLYLIEQQVNKQEDL